jgi:uncharacterized protein
MGNVFGIPLWTILLLICSNLFMTIAWYGHLKFPNVPLWTAILMSWGIAFFEYCFQVPANRLGYTALQPSQLKVLQEVITLIVFAGFTTLYFREQLHWNHAVSFLLLIGAVFFAFHKF